MYRSKIPPTDDGGNKGEKKVAWTTHVMAQTAHLSRETYLVSITRDTIIYLIFWINLTFICLAMISPYMYHMTDAIRSQLADQKFKSEFDTMTFNEIRTVSDFWYYMERLYPKVIFSNNLFDEEDDTKSKFDVGILYVNKLIGVPTIRQVTVRNNSCTTHPRFRRAFLVCYDSYHSGSISTHDLPTLGVVGPEIEAFKWQSEDDLEGTSYIGRVATYDGSGFFTKLGRSQHTTTRTISRLKYGMWVRRETRAIFVDTTVYNPNMNLFTNILIVFELPPTGGVLPNIYFRTMKLIRYFTILDHIVLGCEIVFFCFVLFYLAEEIREVIFLKFYYFNQITNYIDVLIVVTSLAYFICILYQHIVVTALMEKVGKSITQYNSFAKVSRNEMVIKNVQAVCLFVATLKLFQFINIDKTMRHLTRTIKRSAKDVLGFSIMFLLIFVSFAELGYLIFGTQVPAFSGFGVSMFTLLRTILGDFDYAEIEKAHRILAPIYFILFIFLVFFVLINMFLAIISDTYSDVKTEMDVAPTQIERISFWRRGLYNFFTDCGCGACTPRAMVKMNDDNATVENIVLILRGCGYSKLDIDTFLARYKIEKNADARVRDVALLIDALKGSFGETESATKKESAEPRKSSVTGQNIAPIIPMDEFVGQQQRLDKIEAVMAVISDKLEALLKRLNSLESVRKY
ncbi:polycystin-2-like [Onthophagus taurus]|uniref:polycystin-2-like n=1 Tax=Onthophagus taurus TaxID=166361 RepID=UPI000C20A26D|nr:polycystin-2-like [Onthophagus taurus]